jgi:hypothetical protein
MFVTTLKRKALIVAWKASSRLVHERTEGFGKQMALRIVGLLEKVSGRGARRTSRQDKHSTPGRSPAIVYRGKQPKTLLNKTHFNLVV